MGGVSPRLSGPSSWRRTSFHVEGVYPFQAARKISLFAFSAAQLLGYCQRRSVSALNLHLLLRSFWYLLLESLFFEQVIGLTHQYVFWCMWTRSPLLKILIEN